MSARAHVEFNLLDRRVYIHVADADVALSFAEPVFVGAHPAEVPDVDPLKLPEDIARAMYEALAEHFGHSGHDTRALRKDYDAERARVDRMLDHLLRGDR